MIGNREPPIESYHNSGNACYNYIRRDYATCSEVPMSKVGDIYEGNIIAVTAVIAFGADSNNNTL